MQDKLQFDLASNDVTLTANPFVNSDSDIALHYFRAIRPVDLKQIVVFDDEQWRGNPFALPQMHLMIWQGYADSHTTAFLAAKDTAALRERNINVEE